MTPKFTPPVLGSDSFNCPHCGALAHQTWYMLRPHRCEGTARPYIIKADQAEEIKNNTRMDAEDKPSLIEYIRKASAGKIFSDKAESLWSELEVVNLNLSKCFSCNEFTVWKYGEVISPVTHHELSAHESMPEDIALDFAEAARIVSVSPRGAAALLRLIIQKVCAHVGEQGKNIDSDIASLVRKGLDPQVQQALDIVRVIGNEAVHPGQIDLKDDTETAYRLFEIVNLIVETMIARPAKVEAMFKKLPESKRKAIEARDAPKEVPKPGGTVE